MLYILLKVFLAMLLTSIIMTPYVLVRGGDIRKKRNDDN